MTEQPFVSIITVVLNRAHDIRHTLESIKMQELDDLQYIVVDGGSTDGTLQILEEYSHIIDILVSEPDKGIYDAMNKGLKMATGLYVLFINGGDSLHQPDVLKRLHEIAICNDFPDILYGECMFVNRERKELGVRSILRSNPLPEQLGFHSFRYGSNVTHQCFMVKRSLSPPYDLSYRWSSDIDWMLNCLKKANTALNTHLIISDFVLGDATQNHFFSSMAERFRIMTKHYGLPSTLAAHIYMSLIRPIKSIRQN